MEVSHDDEAYYTSNDAEKFYVLIAGYAVSKIFGNLSIENYNATACNEYE